MSALTEEHFDALVEALIAGRLTSQERDELEEALRASPDRRRKYLEVMRLHRDLSTLAEEDGMAGRPTEAMNGVSSRARSRSLFASVLALVAVAAAAILVMLRQQPAEVVPRPQEGTEVPPFVAETVPSPLPVVAEAAEARVFGFGLSPKPGESLEIHRKYVLTQGQLALRFGSGARVVLTAPCSFSPSGPESLLVRSGQCSVYAPPGAEGFQVQTPAAEVVDLGTRFTVNVSVNGETDLLVVDGEATVTGTDSPSRTPLLLTAGQSVFVEADNDPRMPSASLNSLRFIETLPDRVVRYDATLSDDGYADELLSVTVQRGGREITYSRGELIRSRLTHFTAFEETAVFTTRRDETLPEGPDRLKLLDEDWSLVTGIINPRPPFREEPAGEDEPVFEIEFVTPVVNGPGPDILLFDLHLLVQDERGNIVRVASGDPSREKRILTIDRFDIDLVSPYALDLFPHKTYRSFEAVESVQDLITNRFEHGKQTHIDAKALVAGIDLSDLGYAPGESLRNLVILDAPPGEDQVDPVLIVGLPEE